MWNHLSLFNVYLLKYNWKKKLEKSFFRRRIWVPKPVYRSPKWPAYVTDIAAKQLYWNQTLAWVFSCKSAEYFQNIFLQEHLWRVASESLRITPLLVALSEAVTSWWLQYLISHLHDYTLTRLQQLFPLNNAENAALSNDKNHQSFCLTSNTMFKWVKVFKNGPSEICGRQRLKNPKCIF